MCFFVDFFCFYTTTVYICIKIYFSIPMKTTKLLLLAALSQMNLWSQGTNSHPGTNNQPTLITCYQTIRLDSAGSYNILKTGGQRKFTITHGGNCCSYRYFQIWAKNKYSGLWGNQWFDQFPRSYYPILNPNTGVSDSIEIFEVTAFTNWTTGELDLYDSEADSFIINFITENEEYEGGPLVKSLSRISNVKLNFVEETKNFILSPKNGKTCFTFDDFNLNLNNMLSGFCGGIVNSKIKLADSSYNSLGLPGNWSRNIDLSESIGTRIPAICGTDPNIDPCSVYGNPPYPVPCNCLAFKFEFEITSCLGNELECPNIKVSIPLKICCKCDARSNNNEN